MIWTIIFKPAGGHPALHIMATKKKTAAKRPAPRKKPTAKKKPAAPRKFCKPMKGPIPACELSPITNPTEAIYSFLGFLTTRDKEVILSSHNDCAPVAQLAAAFCEASKLPGTTETWPNWTAPLNTEHITNVPAIGYSEKSLASEPLTVEKAEDQMLGAILGMSTSNQDATIAGFLRKILTQRNNRVQNMQNVIADVERDMQEAMASLTTLNSVLRGEFAVVKQ